MVTEQASRLETIRQSVRDVCKAFPGSYWRELDRERAYPTAFVDQLTSLGWLSVLIPEEYGGAGLGVTEASAVLEEVNRSGGNSAACHAQMYTMAVVLRHGSEELKQRYLPGIATGDLRLQAFAVTEPDAGSETTRLRTTAVRKGDTYVVNGQKMFISRVEHSDLMVLLARTTPYDELEDKTQGLSAFLIDLREVEGMEVRPLELMLNHHSTALFFDNMEIPADSLIGEEGMGFRYVIDSWNAERILIAAEALGDGYWFIDQASKYASERVVFGRPIGANQGVQFPIAQAYAHLEAASLMRDRAAEKFDRGESCGAEANMSKLLAADASWEAANACLNTFGGAGFDVETDVERKFRETRLWSIAPVNNNLVLAYVGQRVLGMPRSY
ncbi:MAG: acyl-CoA dehydrogenase family protein [Dehalococcoidia bacterium]